MKSQAALIATLAGINLLLCFGVQERDLYVRGVGGIILGVWFVLAMFDLSISSIIFQRSIRLPTRGVWLPALFVILDSMLIGMAAVIGGMVAPESLFYTSVPGVLAFYFMSGSALVFLRLAEGWLRNV